MLKNYVKIAFRSLNLQKGYSAINIIGLAIGIAACILIILFVKNETGYDRFHEKANRIYRVAVDGLFGNTVIEQTSTCAPLAATAVKEFPEIEAATRITENGRPTFTYKEKVYNEFNVCSCDSNIFSVFTFPILKGDPYQALRLPNSLAIFETTAKKIFGMENPVGKIIKAAGLDFIVTAVVKDIPEKSHIKFDIFVSFSTFDYSKSNEWWNNNILTYFLLKEKTDYKALEAKLPLMQKKYMALNGESFETWESKGNRWHFYLQPLTQIHLTTGKNGVTVSNNIKTYVYIFSIVGLFILVLACINFTNLTTAKASLRFKETGIRRSIGSNSISVFFQFLTESIIITFFATILALILVEAVLHPFGVLTGITLQTDYFSNWYTIPALLVFVIFVGTLAGLVPACQMSTNKPLDLLRSKKNQKSIHIGTRGTLIVFQFFISISLIISTITVYKQLNYLQNKELGFNKENIIVIQSAYDLRNQLLNFEKDIRSNPLIINCAASSSAPGYGHFNNACLPEGFDEKKLITLNRYYSDFDFPSTYKFELVKGRFFSKDFTTDTMGILINEAAQKLLNWKDPIGKKISFSKYEVLHVIGVIKDYPYESLQKEIRPACIMPFNRAFNNAGMISVRISGKNIPQTIDFIKSTWNKYTNGAPLQYSFFDKDYGQLYEKERAVSRAFTIFSLFAIFIACLGLLGMASFMAERKSMEIGVRRINGANSLNVYMMLAVNFNKWICISFLMASPVAWYAMHKWLENFAYKTDLSWWVFLLAGFLSMTIALLTVSFHSWKAAKRNPVETLRYE